MLIETEKNTLLEMMDVPTDKMVAQQIIIR
jgi:hypothetical protein